MPRLWHRIFRLRYPHIAMVLHLFALWMEIFPGHMSAPSFRHHMLRPEALAGVVGCLHR